MFTISKQLTTAETGEFRELLEAEVAPRLAPQASGYAKGRQFAWLSWKPTFKHPPQAIAQPEGHLWSRLRDLVPGIELAECWRNGLGSSPGIHPHKDASYAANTAYTLNLGRTLFRIWLPNDTAPHAALQPRKVHPRLTEYAVELRGGELLSFDCKRLHGSHTNAEERWGIGMWTFKPAWRRSALFVS